MFFISQLSNAVYFLRVQKLNPNILHSREGVITVNNSKNRNIIADGNTSLENIEEQKINYM